MENNKLIALALSGLLLLAAIPAHAQVASLGKGWLLNSSAGSITSAPSEVISGRNSIKGFYSGSDQHTTFLASDPTFVAFAANQTYTLTFTYRVLSPAPVTLQHNFFSGTGSLARDFSGSGQDGLGGGSFGTITMTRRLSGFGDYQVDFEIVGTGAIVVDDVRVTDANGQLVASENAEGPALASGPLNFQLTDATTMNFAIGAFAEAAASKDLDGDGYPEIILTVTNAHTLASPFQPIIVQANGQMRIATSDFFSGGIPTTINTPMIQFADINGDGLKDIIFAEAGLDQPPWTGARLGVALNMGGGKYRDVSSLIPADQLTNRVYATVVGDMLGDGKAEILLPDSTDGANTALLRWNGNGFDEIRNWIPQSIWRNAPAYLHALSWMSLADFDQDGKQDLLVTGQDHNPNFQIVFGGTNGFTAGTLLVLPDGPFGHTQGGTVPDGTVTTGEVSPVVVADFNNDGLPDIFAITRQQTEFSNGSTPYGDSIYQVRLNQGSRKFLDVTPAPAVDLGRVEYSNLYAIDINNDGFLDIVGQYSTSPLNTGRELWGWTVFLNDGTGAFQVVDGTQFLAATTTPPNGGQFQLGSFVPTVVNPQRLEGIVFESVGGCAPGVGLCTSTSQAVNLYKVTANGAIGTGPNFTDSTLLGVPGFNEFYYLRHYPDGAAAVQAGQFRTGFDHFVAVGAVKGYKSHAANNAIPQGVSVWSDNKAYRVTYQDDGNVVIYDAKQAPVWTTKTSGTTTGTLVMQGDGNLVLRDGQNVVRWQSGTAGNPGASFAVQDDGNLVIFSGTGQAIWGAYGH